MLMRLPRSLSSPKTPVQDEAEPAVSTPGDQRKNLRVELIVEKITDHQQVRTLFGYASNISRSGMFIHTENPKEPGAQFEVAFNLPEPVNKRVSCHCEVVWRRMHQPKDKRPAGMGLRFLDLPKKVALAIETWVSSDHNESA